MEAGVKTTLWADERGATMVEYALLVVLIAIVAILATTLVGEETSEMFSEIASGIANS